MIRYFLLFLTFSVFPLNKTQVSLANARKQNPFLMLAYQAKCGNQLSIMTYEAYSDILANKRKPRNLYNPKVAQKLISLGLCCMVDGKLQLCSYYVNDQILSFGKKK